MNLRAVEIREDAGEGVGVGQRIDQQQRRQNQHQKDTDGNVQGRGEKAEGLLDEAAGLRHKGIENFAQAW